MPPAMNSIRVIVIHGILRLAVTCTSSLAMLVGRTHLFGQVTCHALQVAGAHHRQHVAAPSLRSRRRAAMYWSRSSISVAYSERRVTREFAEARLQHVAFLQALDVVRRNLVIGEQAAAQPGDQLHPVPPAQRLQDAAEGDADVAIDQLQGQAACARFQRRRLELGARLDIELLGQPALVGGQGQVRRRTVRPCARGSP